jgi:pimeloyl-ACP methyl ester carboxylesterase
MNDTSWIDRESYPFTSQYIDVPDGRMHYVDEGQGETLLMLHGTPMWSYLYRHLISGLRDRYRVVVPDHLGFGLSDKPAHYSYRPQDQARNVAAFIRQLDLHDITLVVHDFGGPIGLSYALEEPDNIRRCVIFNTWLWPLQDDFEKVLVGRLLGSPLGRWLFMRFNFEVNVITPAAFGDRSKLTRANHDHYRQPLQDRTARHAVWVYAKELLGSRDWYQGLWDQRAVLGNIPALIVWGMKDPVFGKKYLDRWQSILPEAQTVTLPETGHYVQEEAGARLLPHLELFLE